MNMLLSDRGPVCVSSGSNPGSDCESIDSMSTDNESHSDDSSSDLGSEAHVKNDSKDEFKQMSMRAKASMPPQKYELWLPRARNAFEKNTNRNILNSQ